jgi:small GTP-binding protein
MNVDEFSSGNVRFISWDIGGQQAFRESLWESYMAGSMGIVYVIDSAERTRFIEAKIELWKYVLDNPRVHNIPILVLANKQDLESAASAGEVARALNLHKVTTHSYAIVPTSAKTGFNVEEGLEWLRQRVTEKLETL